MCVKNNMVCIKILRNMRLAFKLRAEEVSNSKFWCILTVRLILDAINVLIWFINSEFALMQLTL